MKRIKAGWPTVTVCQKMPRQHGEKKEEQLFVVFDILLLLWWAWEEKKKTKKTVKKSISIKRLLISDSAAV